MPPVYVYKLVVKSTIVSYRSVMIGIVLYAVALVAIASVCVPDNIF